MIKHTTQLFLILMTIFVFGVPLTVIAAPPEQEIVCAEDYTIQAGDWLSKLADKFYGEVQAYPVIVGATNLAAQTNDSYSPITDANRLEVGQQLCIPSGETAQAILTGRLRPGGTGPGVPVDKMLLITGNRTYANLPATLTIVGGEFGDGQTFELNPGQEVQLELAQGEYQAIWGENDGQQFGRKFQAMPGSVVISWIVPEDDVAFAVRPPGGHAPLGRVERPAATTIETPYFIPEQKALLVAGNVGTTGYPSTLTLFGGGYGQTGQSFIVNPYQETIIALTPGEYQATWTTPIGATNGPYSKERTFTVEAGQIEFGWINPDEGQVIFQRPGQPGEIAQ
jgi:hypothetical protein